MTLKELQDSGALDRRLVEVGAQDCVSFSEAPEHVKDVPSVRPVIIDGAKWVATMSAIPVSEAAKVYSGNDQLVGIWVAKTSTFQKLKPVIRKMDHSQTLAIINTFKKMEVKQMPLDLESLVADAADQAKGFDKEKTEPKEKSAAQIEREKKHEQFMQLQDSILKSATVSIVPDSILRFNRQNGRLLGFITATNATHQLAKIDVPVQDAAGNFILTADATPEDQAKLNKGEKVRKSVLECKTSITAKNKKPSQPKAVIIKQPVATSGITLATLGTNIDESNYELSKPGDSKVMVLPIEAAYAYLAYAYGDMITEDEKIMDGQQDTLQIVHSWKKRRKGSVAKGDVREVDVEVSSFKVGSRKSVLVEGNYFPAKTFILASQGSEEYNNAFVKFLANKEYESLSDEAKSMVTPDGKASVGSFTVKDYVTGEDKSIASLAGVNIKTTVKDGKTTTRRTYAMEKDFNVIMQNPVYGGFAKKLEEYGFGPVQLKSAVAKFTTKQRAAKDGAVNKGTDFTTVAYLAALKSGKTGVETAASLEDILKAFD